MKGALKNIFDLEKQLHNFKQNHRNLQRSSKIKTISYKKKISSKYAAVKI